MGQSFYQCGKQGCNNNGDTLRLPMGWTSQWSQWKTGLPIPASSGVGVLIPHFHLEPAALGGVSSQSAGSLEAKDIR